MHKVNHRISIKNVANGIVVILITILIIANFLPVKMSVEPNKFHDKTRMIPLYFVNMVKLLCLIG